LDRPATDTANSSEELGNYQRWSFFWKASLYAKEKKTEEANKAAEEFKKRLEEDINKKSIRNYFFLKSILEIEEGNFSKAIEFVEKGLPLTSYGPLNLPAWVIDNLAFALYSLGNLEKARVEYEKISRLTTGRLQDGDIFVKSFYMLGKIYEQQGDTAKAIEHYEKFLTLWKDADPGIAEVKDAKKRLAGLKAH
jgi:tetratricopeptide (TPR) repeat protein